MITAANYLFLWNTSERNFTIFLGGGFFEALTDEQVHARLYHTIRYQNVTLLMVGFYQVRV